VRVAITPLRASAGGLDAAATAAVEYVCGPLRAPRRAAPERSGAPPVAYYADQTIEGPGHWLGNGAPLLGLAGTVNPDQLQALLGGRHPISGDELIPPRGSTRRAHPKTAPSQTAPTWDQDSYTFTEAAALIGVDASHLRRVAGRTRGLLNRTGGSLETLSAIEADGTKYLLAQQGPDAKWRVTRAELQRFQAQRRPANVVMGFDVTFSAPKSVSILWATGDAPTRAEITTAVQRAVQSGFDYLERRCAFAGRETDRIKGQGFAGAAFTHATSRNLDPQLHTHVVLANVLETSSGEHRALDGSALFAQAKTAGYLAGATLQHELARRLGVRWQQLRSGVAEIDGIPRAAIEAMSTRRREIDTLAEELNVTSPAARQVLALRSRPTKQTADFEELRRDWREALADAGFTQRALDRCLHQKGCLEPIGEDATEILFRALSHHDGLTANASTFDRRDTIQAIADRTTGRLDAATVERLAEQFLVSSRVLTLQECRGDEATTRDPRRGSRPHAAGKHRYTTPALVKAETNVMARFRSGLRVRAAIVSPETVAQLLQTQPELGPDQRNAINSLCRSGHQLQCLVGAAGTGKTYTLRLTAQAWQQSGYRVMGAAVQGTVAENLQRATDIPSQTVAALLAHAARSGPDEPILDPQTILIIDEASTVGTFDLSRIATLAGNAQAKLVLAGDPSQHGAVAAGGGFAALVRQRTGVHPELRTLRRQLDPRMETARLAVDELRRRDTDTALHRLMVDGRIEHSSDVESVYAAIVHDWHQDRTERRDDPRKADSCMISEHHQTRRELVGRARALLQSTGELHGPALCVADHQFQAGDEVICRSPAHNLYPAGQPELYLRNGTLGVVTEVRPKQDPHPGLVVGFAHRGELFIPLTALQRDARPGMPGILTHSYALTSHAAQGATYETGRILTVEGGNPVALYVGASRGRTDLRIYAAGRHPTNDTPDTLRSRGHTPLQELVQSARKTIEHRLAIELDPTLTGVPCPGSPRAGIEHRHVTPNLSLPSPR
jgi:conjugative relaxase-like TrwC/TraI family protein